VSAGAAPGERFRVLVVGGLTRLDAEYREGAPDDVEVDAVMADCTSLERRAEAADGLVLVASNVSHAAAAKVRSVARRRNKPLTAVRSAGAHRIRGAVADIRTRLRP